MSYVQGFVIPVPTDRRDAYRAMAEEAWPIFRDYGALSLHECWGDNVPRGKHTDFYGAVKAAGKPTRNLDDRIYEIEDAIRLATQSS